MNTFPTPKPDTRLYLSPDAPFRDPNDWEDEDGAVLVQTPDNATDLPDWIYAIALGPCAACSILALAMAFLVRLP